MPGWRTYTYWRRTQVSFQEELHRVKGSRAEMPEPTPRHALSTHAL